MAWNDQFVAILEREMWGQRLLLGLDLTFEVLGHIVSEDGGIVGIMREPPIGRLVEKQDKALVYNAIATLQKERLVYHGVDRSNIMITDGKVRFLSIDKIKQCSDEVFHELTGIWHWKQLETLFEELESHPNDMPIMHQLKPTIRILPPLPSPNYPLPWKGPTICWIQWHLFNSSSSVWMKRQQNVSAQRHPSLVNPCSDSLTIQETDDDQDSRSKGTIMLPHDSPLLPRHRSRKPMSTSCPYSRPPRPKDVLLA